MKLNQKMNGLVIAGLLLICGRAHAAEPIATAFTNWDDVTLELMVVERRSRVLTVKWAVRNERDGSQKVQFALTGNGARTYVVDEESGTKYFALQDEEGSCLASECVYLNSSSHGISEEIDGGKTRRYWMKLPAPPPEVSNVTVFFDETEPLEDVPISER
jgi:hypothetical protein